MEASPYREPRYLIVVVVRWRPKTADKIAKTFSRRRRPPEQLFANQVERGTKRASE